MNRYVVDTHALFWYLTDAPKLGKHARAALDEGKNGQAIIFIPAIVLAELYYLNEKLGRLFTFSETFEVLRQGNQYRLLPFTPEDILDFDQDNTISEMHDRIIAGISRRFNAPCLSVDKQIVQSNSIATIW